MSLNWPSPSFNDQIYHQSLFMPSWWWSNRVEPLRLSTGELKFPGYWPMAIAGFRAFLHKGDKGYYLISQDREYEHDDDVLLQRAASILRELGKHGQIISVATGKGLKVRQPRRRR